MRVTEYVVPISLHLIPVLRRRLAKATLLIELEMLSSCILCVVHQHHGYILLELLLLLIILGHVSGELLRKKETAAIDVGCSCRVQIVRA